MAPESENGRVQGHSLPGQGQQHSPLNKAVISIALDHRPCTGIYSNIDKAAYVVFLGRLVLCLEETPCGYGEYGILEVAL